MKRGDTAFLKCSSSSLRHYVRLTAKGSLNTNAICLKDTHRNTPVCGSGVDRKHVLHADGSLWLFAAERKDALDSPVLCIFKDAVVR